MDPRIHTDTNSLFRLRHDARGFSLLPQQPMASLLSGRKRSRLRGRGLDFEELRHYRPGDDIRTMDWRVTNRTGKPHVRVYTEERDRPVVFIVDQRLSMFFGSHSKMKSVVAAELAALGAWRVLDQGDRVGAILFSDHEIRQLRPKRGQRGIMNMLSQLCTMNQALDISDRQRDAPGQLAEVIALAERMAGHDYLMVLVSDFAGWNEQCLAGIRRMAQHNDLIAGLVFDPLEGDISTATDLVVSDGEFQMQLQPQHKALASRFQEAALSELSALRADLSKHSIPVLAINTIDPVAAQLRQLLGRFGHDA